MKKNLYSCNPLKMMIIKNNLMKKKMKKYYSNPLDNNDK